jgi:hypothetical protein
VPKDVVPTSDINDEVALLNNCGVMQSQAQATRPSEVIVGYSCCEELEPSEPSGGVDLTALSDLLDLHRALVPVNWPHGLDAFTASVLLSKA